MENTPHDEAVNRRKLGGAVSVVVINALSTRSFRHLKVLAPTIISRLSLYVCSGQCFALVENVVSMAKFGAENGRVLNGGTPVKKVAI